MIVGKIKPFQLTIQKKTHDLHDRPLKTTIKKIRDNPFGDGLSDEQQFSVFG